MTNPTNQGGELESPDVIWLQPDNGEERTWCQDKINDEDTEYIKASESNCNILLSPSEICQRYQVQNCHVCDRQDCGDNTNPIVKRNKDLRSQLSAAKETIDKVRRWEYNNFPMGCRDVFPLNGKSRAALRDILKKGDCDDN